MTGEMKGKKGAETLPRFGPLESIELPVVVNVAAVDSVARLFEGVSQAFMGASLQLRIWLQGKPGPADIRLPPPEVGEKRETNYEWDPKAKKAVLKAGKEAASCTNTVYLEVATLFGTDKDSCDKVDAVAILVMINEALNNARDHGETICKDLKDCPNADTLVTYYRWDCRVVDKDTTPDEPDPAKKVFVKQAVIGVLVQVRVNCKK